MVDVVAALIREGERFLICKRPAHKARALMWEFPGGKVESGESPEEALIRECAEELDIRLSVGKLYMKVFHEYPDLTISLSLYEAVIASGTPENKEHEALAWIRPQDIPLYEFCPADIDIIDRIRREG